MVMPFVDFSASVRERFLFSPQYRYSNLLKASSPSPNSSALRAQISPKKSRSSSTRFTELSVYRAFTTSFSLHFVSDDRDDGTGVRVYSMLSADSAPPYACEIPSLCHQTPARYGSSQLGDSPVSIIMIFPLQRDTIFCDEL